jgi:hypothetical protein
VEYGIEIPSIPELASYKVFARAEVLTSKEARCAKHQVSKTRFIATGELDRL